MSEGLNRVTIIGNCCADPELRLTQANMGVLSIRVAANESWFDTTTKEKKERVEYISCTIWGKRGEALNKILSKGSRVCVEGRLQTRTFEDKQGVKQYRTEVVATNVVLLDSRGGGDAAGYDRKADRAEKAAENAPADQWQDDEIPF